MQSFHGSWIVFFKVVSEAGALITIVDSIESEYFISVPLLASTSSVTLLLGSIFLVGRSKISQCVTSFSFCFPHKTAYSPITISTAPITLLQKQIDKLSFALLNVMYVTEKDAKWKYTLQGRSFLPK